MKNSEDMETSEDATGVLRLDVINDTIATFSQKQDYSDLNKFQACLDGKKSLVECKDKSKNTSQVCKNKSENNRTGLNQMNTEIQELSIQKQKIAESMSEEKIQVSELEKTNAILNEESQRLSSEILLLDKRTAEQYSSSIKVGKGIKINNLLKNVTGIEWNIKESTQNYATGFIKENERFFHFTHDQEDRELPDNSVWNKLQKGDEFSKIVF